MMEKKGFYAVIEGSDGTGKSYQANRITKRLARMDLNPLVVFNDETGKMECIQEPGGTPFANEMRRKIKDKSIVRTPWQNVVWFTDARESIANELLFPALDEGRPVITARSWISTMAYQGYGEGVPLDEIREYTRERLGERYMTPDLVCILALQNEMVRKARIQNRGSDAKLDTFESMPPEFQHDMQNGYVRFGADNNIDIIDASRTKNTVARDLWNRVEPLALKLAA